MTLLELARHLIAKGEQVPLFAMPTRPSRKGSPRLRPEKRVVQREGKTHLQTFYVAPPEAPKQPKEPARAEKPAPSETPASARQPQVGDTWESPEGTRRIVGTAPGGAEVRYLVQTGGGAFAYLFTAEDILFEKRRDAQNLERRQAQKKETEAAEEKHRVAEADRQDLDGFMDDATAIQRQRARHTLAKKVHLRSANKIMSVRDLVRQAVKEGARIEEHPRWGTLAKLPDGSFFEEKVLTKTGMQYLRYLLKRQVGDDHDPS